MNAEYKRDMYHNYLVFYDEKNQKCGYQELMIKHNKIEGLLAFENHMIDNKKYFYYEITGYQSLSSVLEKKPIRQKELRIILRDIIEALMRGKEFLLKDNDNILSPEYIFLSLPSYHTKICYYPGYGVSLHKQFHDLFDWLMNKIDYKDKEAVLLVYSLYMKSKDEGCTIYSILSTLNQPFNLDENEVSDQDNFELGSSQNQSIEKQSMVNPMNGKQVTQTNMNKNDHSKFTKQSFDKFKEKLSMKKIENQVNAKNNQNSEQGSKRSFDIDVSSVKKFNLPWNRVNDKKRDSITGRKQPELPFISQRIEEEREKITFSKITFLLAAVFFLFEFIVMSIAVKKKIIYNTIGTEIDPVKVIAVLGISLAVLGYCYSKLFQKANRISKMVQVITYDSPSSDNINFADDDPSQTIPKILFESIEKESILTSSQNSSERSHLNEYEEDKTIMLTDTFIKNEIKLLPVDKETYEIIRISEFPFYVGKLKTHMDYFIPSSTVSKFHAKIIKEKEEYYLIDLNSTNGTFVNGEQIIQEEKRRICKGDEISFADIKYVVSF